MSYSWKNPQQLCNENLLSVVLKDCGANEDKFILFDMMNYGIDGILDVVTTELHNVIPMDNSILLSSICSAMCSQKDNYPNCIGFSSNITTDRTCILYSEVSLMNSSTIGPPLNLDGELYLR